MSASKEWTDWNLTPRGWEEGSHRYDFQQEVKVERPADTVCTCRYRETMTSGFSKLDKSMHIEWSCGDEEKIRELTTQFGESPKHL